MEREGRIKKILEEYVLKVNGNEIRESVDGGEGHITGKKEDEGLESRIKRWIDGEGAEGREVDTEHEADFRNVHVQDFIDYFVRFLRFQFTITSSNSSASTSNSTTSSQSNTPTSTPRSSTNSTTLSSSTTTSSLPTGFTSSSERGLRIPPSQASVRHGAPATGKTSGRRESTMDTSAATTIVDRVDAGIPRSPAPPPNLSLLEEFPPLSGNSNPVAPKDASHLSAPSTPSELGIQSSSYGSQRSPSVNPPASPSKFSPAPSPAASSLTSISSHSPHKSSSAPTTPSTTPTPAASPSRKTNYVPLNLLGGTPSPSPSPTNTSNARANRGRRRVTPLPVAAAPQPSEPFSKVVPLPVPNSSSTPKPTSSPRKAAALTPKVPSITDGSSSTAEQSPRINLQEPSILDSRPLPSSNSFDFILSSNSTLSGPGPAAPSTSSTMELATLTQRAFNDIRLQLGSSLSRRAELSRLSSLYVHLISQRLVSPIAAELSFLFSLLSIDPDLQVELHFSSPVAPNPFHSSASSTLASVTTGASIPPLDLLSSASASLVRDRIVTQGAECIWFACKTLQRLELYSSPPLLSSLGSPMVSALLSHKLLEQLTPKLHQRLAKRWEEMKSESNRSLMASSASELLALEPLSLAAAEKTESRHDYQQQSEQAIYNNREKCRDGFCGLLRDWQDHNTTSLPQASSKQQPQQRPGTKPVTSTETLAEFASKVNTFFQTLSLPNYPWFAKFFQSQLLRACFNGEEIEPELQGRISSEKLKKLQQRFSSSKRRVSTFLEEQSSFFRLFLESTNNHCFVACLSNSIAFTISELHRRLSISISFYSARINSFADDVLSLKILSRFLGTLHCKPTTQCFGSFADSGNSSQVRNSVIQEAIALQDISRPCFDLLPILSDAIRERTLLGTLPWIVDYLSVLAQDRVLSQTRHVRLTVRLLEIVHHVLLATSNSVTPNYNRSVLALELESLFATFQVSLNSKALSPRQTLEENCRNLEALTIESFELLLSPTYSSPTQTSGALRSSRHWIDETLQLLDSNFVFCCCPSLAEVMNLIEDSNARILSRTMSKLSTSSSTALNPHHPKKLTPMVQPHDLLDNHLLRNRASTASNNRTPLYSSSSSLLGNSSQVQSQLRKWFRWQYPELNDQLGPFITKAISSNACSMALERHYDLLNKFINEWSVAKIQETSTGSEMEKVLSIASSEYFEATYKTVQGYIAQKVAEAMRLLAPMQIDSRALEIAIGLLINETNQSVAPLLEEQVNNRTRRAWDERVSKALKKQKAKDRKAEREEARAPEAESPDRDATSKSQFATLETRAWKLQLYLRTRGGLASASLGAELPEPSLELMTELQREDDLESQDDFVALEGLVTGILMAWKRCCSDSKREAQRLVQPVFKVSMEVCFFVLRRTAETLSVDQMLPLFLSASRQRKEQTPEVDALGKLLKGLVELWKLFDALEPELGIREKTPTLLLDHRRLTKIILEELESSIERYRFQQAMRGLLDFGHRLGLLRTATMENALLRLYRELSSHRSSSAEQERIALYFHELICDVAIDIRTRESSNLALMRLYSMLITSFPSPSASSQSIHLSPASWTSYYRARLQQHFSN